MLGTRGIWHKGWKAVTEHGPVPIGLGQLRRGPLAAVPHRRGPLRGARPRRAAPGEGRGAEGAVVRGGGEVRRAAAQRPRSIFEFLALRVPRRGADERAVHLLPRHVRGAASTSAANTLDVSYKILAEVEFTADVAGRDLRPGVALRRPLAVRQGRQAASTSTTSSASRRSSAIVGGRADARARTSSASSSRRSASASTTSRTAPLKLYVDEQVVAEGRDPHDRVALQPVRRGARASATTAATRSAASTRPKFPFTGGRIVKVVFDVADDAYVDVERQMAAALARD